MRIVIEIALLVLVFGFTTSTITIKSEDHQKLECQFVDTFEFVGECKEKTFNDKSKCKIKYNLQMNDDLHDKKTDLEEKIDSINVTFGKASDFFDITDFLSPKKAASFKHDDTKMIYIKTNQSYFVFFANEDPSKIVNLTKGVFKNEFEAFEHSPFSKDPKYGNGFFEYKTKEEMNVIVSTDILDIIGFNTQNDKNVDEEITGKLIPESKEKIVRRNCLDENLGYKSKEFFYSKFRWNLGIWVFAFQLMAFFILTLCATPDEPLQRKNKNNRMTYHPFYSVRNTGHPEFTKTSRYTLIFMTTSTFVLVNAFIINIFRPIKNRDTNIISHIVIPALISIPLASTLTYIFGTILDKFKKGHRYYIRKYKTLNSFDQKIFLEDEYEAILAKFQFAFYVPAFLVFIGFHWGAIILMDNWPFEIRIFWVISLLASFVVDFLILDFLFVALSKVKIIGNLMTLKGYYYDYSLQNEFDEIQQDE